MVEDCEVNSIKIVMVGDVRVGKSALIQRFITNQPPNNIYLPTGFDKYSASFEVAGCQYYATIWDTSGSPSYDTVRGLAYQDTDVFLICFHLGDWYSLHNALNKWYPEVRKFSSPSTPIVLVGCQNDQRFVENLYASFHLVQHSVSGAISPLSAGVAAEKQRIVYTEEALEVCRQMCAITLVETCSYNAVTVREAFEVAALAANGKLAAVLAAQQNSASSKSKNLLSVKHLSLSSSTTNTSITGSCTSSPGSDSSSSVKLKSSASSTHLLTRHKSLFKLRKCKSKGELAGAGAGSASLKVDGKKEKSCVVM